MTATSLPRVVSTREHVVGGITLRVHVLEDGRSLVEKEGFDAFIRAVEAGRLTAREVMTAAMWVKHGDA